MNRRDLLSAAGTAGLALIASTAMADEMHMHMDHDHMGMMMPSQGLTDTALACEKTGLACLNHCLESFMLGDTSMASCARSVDQMLSTCATLAKLSATNSSHLAMMARVALEVCVDCEKECRKHADHHAVCKACAEACAACAEECKKIAA